MVQNVKNFCMLHLISQEPYIIWLSFMIHTCKMIISPGFFSFFSKFWFFELLREWKGKKQSKMAKKFVHCTPYFRYHTQFMVYICKMIYNILQCFKVHRGGKRTKNGPKWQKNLSVVLAISGTTHHMIVIYGANW